MSRPNTSRKIDNRIIHVLKRSETSVTLDHIHSELRKIAAATGYPLPDIYKITERVNKMVAACLIATEYPTLDAAFLQHYTSRELNVIRRQMIRYSISPLYRLAMVVDEE